MKKRKWIISAFFVMSLFVLAAGRAFGVSAPIFTIPDVNATPAKSLSIQAAPAAAPLDDGPFLPTVNYYGDITENFKNDYEKAFQAWNEAIYVMSRGMHSIKIIDVYANTTNDHADVIWSAEKWPCAHVGGFWEESGAKQFHIYMGDDYTWDVINTEKYGYKCFGWFGSVNWDEFDKALKGIGYVFAHESGHYIYGQYDEYTRVPPNGDPTPEDPVGWEGRNSSPHQTDSMFGKSIMNGVQHYLATHAKNTSERDEYLSFSTSANYPDDGVHYETAQTRMYNNRSSWETFFTHPKLIEYFPKLWAFSLPKFSPSNTGNTTSGAAKPTISYAPGTAPPVQIRWHTQDSASNVFRVIYLLDNSGSMSGTPIDEAKVFLTAQVGVHKPGDTVGIYTFNSTLKKDVPYTAIAPETVAAGRKSDMIAEVKKIRASGNTTIYNSL